MKMLFVITMLFLVSCQKKHGMQGIETAKQELKIALNKKSNNPVLPKRIIGDRQTAIEIAESVLFRIYGKQNIIEERPYEVYLINGYWVLNGTIPEGWLGGGFIIVLNSKDSKILRLSHYK